MLLVLAGPARAQRSASSPAAHAPDPRIIDSLFAPYDRPDMPGASIVVIHDGKVAFTHAYGMADLETHTPATIQTDYRLASLTKQFTATAIMLLVQDGRLHYDDRVIDLLPGFPAYGRDIRVRHLLNHTSGIWDYEDFVPDTQRVQVKDKDVLALIGRVDSTYFPPGTKFRYSNTGYALLSLIVAQVSGKPFARFLHDRIFAPLGMHSTVAYEAGISTVPHRAYGYTIRASGVRRTDQSSTSAVLGDGGVYSSVADLVAWDHALETHALVSAEAQRLAWTPPVLPNGAVTHYGFGWFIDRDRGLERLTHWGETRGFMNAIERYPDQRLSVIVLTNRAGGHPWDLAQQVADLWLAASGAIPREEAGHAATWPFEVDAR
jgi:CubicO group peptidase (beta-lactamase class C family)